LAQQEPLKIAFLGPEGTFTQAAVFKQFGASVRALPLPAIDEVFHEVEAGVADFGVVPIENSSEGTVNHTLDMFLTSALKICGEVEMRIRRPWRNAAAGWTISCPTLKESRCRATRRVRAARAMSVGPRPSPAALRPKSTDSCSSPVKSRTARPIRPDF